MLRNSSYEETIIVININKTHPSLTTIGRGHPGVRVENVRHDDDGHAQAGGIVPTALFPEPPPPSEVASRATAATRPAFSGAPLVVLFVYISI